jgi:hypothetical protein
VSLPDTDHTFETPTPHRGLLIVKALKPTHLDIFGTHQRLDIGVAQHKRINELELRRA